MRQSLNAESNVRTSIPRLTYDLERLTEIVGEHPEPLFDHFHIPYKNLRRIHCPCLIHGGDNKNGMNIYLQGYRSPFVWKCRTHQCESVFKKTLVGFTRGLLSVDKCDWRSSKRIYPFNETIKFLINLYKLDPAKLIPDPDQISKKIFLAQTAQSEEKKGQFSRESIRDRLVIPSQYFIDREFSPEILDKYDVGISRKIGGSMTDRIIVPVYDEDFKYIGCSGRSFYEECQKCFSYHKDSCQSCGKSYFSKWKHSNDLGNFLYNFWYAKPFITTSSTAILVESPGNVWRLEEAGIRNSVAMFGVNFTEAQQLLLDKCGVMDLVLVLDGDKAGREGTEEIIEKCGKYYNFKTIEIPTGKDVADLDKETILHLFKGYI